MATLLESLGIFKDILDMFLPFLLVFATIFALLTKTKFLTENISVNGVIAFTIAMIVALSGAGKFISALTPFMAVMFIIIVLIFLSFLFLGAKSEWFFTTKGPSILIIIIAMLFVFYVFGTLYGTKFSQLEMAGAPLGTITVEEVSEGGEKVIVSQKISKENIPGPETCDFSVLTGGKAFACMMGHPKFLGTLVLMGLLAVATFFVVYVPKS